MRSLLRILAGAFLFAGLLLGYVLRGSGITRQVDHQFGGECRPVTGITGAEDVAIHRETGVAYFTGIEEPTLGIYAYDLMAEDPAPLPILPEASRGIFPLGLSLWYGEGEPDRLFVVDRKQPNPGVEIFELTTPKQLTPVRRVEAPAIRYPNDLVAVGPTAFYASNTHASPFGSTKRMAETFLRLPTGDVAYHDGAATRVVADGISYPNGVNVRRDLAELYVASTSTSEVHVFDRDDDGALHRTRSLPTPGLADNIDLMADGRLMVGLHPKALDAAAHLSDATKRAPSRVITLDPRADADPARTIVYDDPGTELSASATGACWRDHLLIGAVREPFFLHCRFDAEQLVSVRDRMPDGCWYRP